MWKYMPLVNPSEAVGLQMKLSGLILNRGWRELVDSSRENQNERPNITTDKHLPLTTIGVI